MPLSSMRPPIWTDGGEKEVEGKASPVKVLTKDEDNRPAKQGRGGGRGKGQGHRSSKGHGRGRNKSEDKTTVDKTRQNTAHTPSSTSTTFKGECSYCGIYVQILPVLTERTSDVLKRPKTLNLKIYELCCIIL